MTAIDSPVADLRTVKHRGAVLDDTHIGHINGAMGTILQGDIAPRLGWGARLKTAALLIAGLLQRWAAVLHPCLGRIHHRDTQRGEPRDCLR